LTLRKGTPQNISWMNLRNNMQVPLWAVDISRAI
jgi:hypothetical protein